MVGTFRPSPRIRTVGAVLVVLTASILQANEVTVQNDSLANGGSGNIQAGFAAGESAAAWLTSPCAGNIVAVQVFWLSQSGGTTPSLEDSITISAAGTFPSPGTPLAVLEGPVMNDGVVNEFRYLDENNTVPISVPVTQGQVFVVAFRFANSPDPSNGPSVVTDFGCQNGKNAINAQGFGWQNACSLGVSGDFFIRAVVDCQEQQGACCLTDGTCQLKTLTQCNSAGGNYRGNGTTCGASTCNGACCLNDGTCSQVNQGSCTSSGGRFKGVAIACTVNLCKGACCLPDGSCLDTQSSTACTTPGGAYKGDSTTCGGVTCSGACCYSNGTCQQQTLTQCNSGGGNWNGPNTNCGSFTCPTLGACCMGDGSCINNQTQAACTSNGGSWDGTATVCGANGVCERACCFSGGCVDLTKSDCDVSSGTWQGILYHCTGSNCPTGACCMPLGNCVESTTPASCSAMGGIFKNGQTCAQANCPVPIGACCVYASGGCIANRTPSQCNTIGGTWAGASTTCPAACCPGPAPYAADINNDGAVNAKDIQRFTGAMLGIPTTLEKCRGDYNQDGSLNVADIPGFTAALLAVP